MGDGAGSRTVIVTVAGQEDADAGEALGRGLRVEQHFAVCGSRLAHDSFYTAGAGVGEQKRGLRQECASGAVDELNAYTHTTAFPLHL
jgi:hypothetical protein